jgi:hypothetical protein
MKPFTMSSVQHKNCLACCDEINQIDQELELAKLAGIDVPQILVDELTIARERIYNYLKYYTVDKGREVLKHG